MKKRKGGNKDRAKKQNENVISKGVAEGYIRNMEP